eukprot:TRINITY_DN9768_c0_g1_i1.p1 TRINITY_DN9768_c0_g1~~TRINITY_DN9768_c0_g1_i1.p1  ORF type:complete len:214 (+),score=29.69 TRINITY_DN9768_c0_g1_i1:66-644(+)
MAAFSMASLCAACLLTLSMCSRDVSALEDMKEVQMDRASKSDTRTQSATGDFHGRFVLGSGDTCPEGSMEIKTWGACQYADIHPEIGGNGYRYVGAQAYDLPGYPSGCIVVMEEPKRNHRPGIYFNLARTGQANAKAVPVCLSLPAAGTCGWVEAEHMYNIASDQVKHVQCVDRKIRVGSFVECLVCMASLP